MKSQPFKIQERPARIWLMGSGWLLPKARRLLKALYPQNPGRYLYKPRMLPGPPLVPGGYPTIQE